MNQMEYNKKMVACLDEIYELTRQQETIHQKIDDIEERVWRLRSEGVDV